MKHSNLTEDCVLNARQNIQKQNETKSTIDTLENRRNYGGTVQALIIGGGEVKHSPSLLGVNFIICVLTCAVNILFS